MGLSIVDLSNTFGFMGRVYDSLVESTHTQVDSLALLMCVICAVIGGLIGIYSVGYMKSYHENHRGVLDRSSTFLSLLFVFMAAMFGLVLSSNLIWLYFFWEITSVISFC